MLYMGYNQKQNKLNVEQLNVLGTIETTFGVGFQFQNWVDFEYDRQVLVAVTGKINFADLKRLEYHNIEVQTIAQKADHLQVTLRIGEDAF